MRLLLITLFSVCLLNAVALEQSQNYTAIEVHPVESGPLKYGGSMELVIHARLKNGKIRKLPVSHRKFKVQVEGAIIKRNIIQLPALPTEKNLQYVKVNVKGKFRKKLSDTLILPINFKNAIHLDFSGGDGIDGKNGRDCFGKPLFGRDGNSGEDGGDGQPGEHGKDLKVQVWSEKDFFSDEEVYVLEITNLTNQEKYYLRYMINTDSIKIVSNGGKGGHAGQGGRGGNGKDGKYDEEKDKFKEAGSGGNGGNGGNGGDGGNGGNIDLLVDENSVNILQYIQVTNKGGSGGARGLGHLHYGRAGYALEGQSQPSDGLPGVDGNGGHNGMDGYFHVRVVKM